MKYRISANVIRRLPRYLRRLTLMERQGVERTSSSGGSSGRSARTWSTPTPEYPPFYVEY